VLQQVLRHKNLNLVLFQDGPIQRAASRRQVLRYVYTQSSQPSASVALCLYLPARFSKYRQMLSVNCVLFVKYYYMFVWLQAEEVICGTLTKRKCDITPRRHVGVYTAQLHLSEVITILCKSTVKSAARIANFSIMRTAPVFTRAHLHYFRLPCVWQTETLSRAASLVAANLCARTVSLVL
jgi:hypothetical protein